MPREEVLNIINSFKKIFNAPITLSFDYHTCKVILQQTGHPDLTLLAEIMEKGGAPFQTGIDDIYQFSQELGISVIDNYSLSRLISIYGVDDQPSQIMDHYSCCSLDLKPEFLLKFEGSSIPFFDDGVYSYSFSSNKEDLQQYYNLRADRYSSSYQMAANEDQYDKPGNILIVKKGDRVVGGVRFIITSMDVPVSLPSVEGLCGSLNSCLPEIYQYKLCEFSKLCVAAEEKSKGYLSKKLINFAVQEATARGCHSMVYCTPAVFLDFYKKIFSEIGYNIKYVNCATFTEKDKVSFKLGNLSLHDMYLGTISLHEKHLLEEKLSQCYAKPRFIPR